RIAGSSRRLAADVEGVVPVTRIDGGLGVDGADVDDIQAGEGRDRRFRADGDVADGHGVVIVRAVHRYVIRIDRAEEVDRGAARIDVVVVSADGDVAGRLDVRPGLQDEVE